LKKIKYQENIITLVVAQPFHIIFIELFKQNYYLAVLREKFIEFEYIQTKILENQRCIDVIELFNSTLQSYSYYRRVKYYPFLCRQNKQLMCFYDQNYMCICDLDRFSNCFIIDHNITYDCQGENPCENEGKCLENTATCLSMSICVCPDCYYGTRCQFSTKGFVSSLDYILGYHIKPNKSLLRQPLIIKISVAITTLMFILGLINGIVCISTFRLKKMRDVGSGLYLLISSWISIILPSVLIMKFCQLVLSQMTILTNRSFVTLNCYSLDIIIKVLLSSNDWLYGFISIDRIITVAKGVKFNKSKSKQLAKWMTPILILLTILSYIHDPIHRHFIDDIDIDEQRTWCFVQYSSSLNIFNSFIEIFHVVIPFSINILSIIFIIILIARSRSNSQQSLTLKEHLQLQIKKHKHYLITSCILIFLVLPRLIISFTSGCMKSPRHSWLFLIGYLISFIPSMMTFIIYVLPSKLYKDQFNLVVDRTTRRLRTIFND
jgi:hypothetical protein